VSRTFAALAFVEIALLLAFVALAHPAREWMVAFPAAAMGMQNALIRRVGEERVRTTYVTGMLTNTAQRLVEFVISTFTHDRKKREKLNEFALYGGIWCCFAGGGIAGAFLELRYGPQALLLPICALAAIAFSDALHPLACVQQQK
jgi:uncharacterized membrane protein YoaK (UPF0700 family)